MHRSGGGPSRPPPPGPVTHVTDVTGPYYIPSALLHFMKEETRAENKVRKYIMQTGDIGDTDDGPPALSLAPLSGFPAFEPLLRPPL